ncbi:GNAT family N-acetyltransferase [Lewinella sp. IMCC34191]|uniref:GNAT family N-acetyltransferase n=1 Tax=Lewinella sp. IMCC34191 TaxID=2259172 RepID=UPI000E261C99|nr:GNAT family N-acetyltransferase [Lewinella sp. IMCC34191]
MKIDIRPFSADQHLGKVIELLSTSLGDVANQQTFSWKHLENPFGASPGLLAFTGDRLVGLRFFMHWRFTNGEQTIHALRPVDTVTHPDARGNGIFKRLTLEGLDRFGQNKLVFNTPNSKSLPGYLKMGWQRYPGSLDYYYSWRTLLGESLGSRQVFLTPKCPQTLPRRTRGPAVFTTDRTPEFFRWRYSRGSYRFATLGQEPTALLVYDLERKGPFSVLRVVDAGGSPEDHGALVRATARREGAVIVRTVQGQGGGNRSPPALSLRRGSSLVVTRGNEGLDPLSLKLSFSFGDLQSIL